MPVFRIGREDVEEAAETLTQAFAAESATNYFFPPEEGNKREKLRMLFGWALEYRLRGNVPALGVRTDEPASALAGVATIKLPAMPVVPGEDALWEAASQAFGPEAMARIDLYDAAHEKHMWPAPHHYVVAIGVRPEYQGRGYGGALLKAAIALAEADPDSAGIGLDTGSDANQAIYERYGFKRYASEPLGLHTARYLFREKQ